MFFEGSHVDLHDFAWGQPLVPEEVFPVAEEHRFGFDEVDDGWCSTGFDVRAVHAEQGHIDTPLLQYAGGKEAIGVAAAGGLYIDPVGDGLAIGLQEVHQESEGDALLKVAGPGGRGLPVFGHCPRPHVKEGVVVGVAGMDGHHPHLSVIGRHPLTGLVWPCCPFVHGLVAQGQVERRQRVDQGLVGEHRGRGLQVWRHIGQVEHVVVVGVPHQHTLNLFQLADVGVDLFGVGSGPAQAHLQEREVGPEGVDQHGGVLPLQPKAGHTVEIHGEPWFTRACIALSEGKALEWRTAPHHGTECRGEESAAVKVSHAHCPCSDAFIIRLVVATTVWR